MSSSHSRHASNAEAEPRSSLERDLGIKHRYVWIPQYRESDSHLGKLQVLRDALANDPRYELDFQVLEKDPIPPGLDSEDQFIGAIFKVWALQDLEGEELIEMCRKDAVFQLDMMIDIETLKSYEEIIERIAQNLHHSPLAEHPLPEFRNQFTVVNQIYHDTVDDRREEFQTFESYLTIIQEEERMEQEPQWPWQEHLQDKRDYQWRQRPQRDLQAQILMHEYQKGNAPQAQPENFEL
ncbi:hypothetical protein BDV28DRAFT_4595 [Aspergillus coremiiformis]|uniref:Uncharacterized protein n=1 Tax=Aspergillus coremiiformis TaxID=138285 RepID=A0A5N6Z3S6_9EURO|nr:hypothetical protein BDV28DRAFT_4595 [Aspergillus coremiiformis]